MNLPRFALTHRTFVLLLVVIVVGLGVQTFLTMSRREDPEITIRTHKVTTRWPGATAHNVENLVTDPLEEALVGIEEVKEVLSESWVGVSILTVEYEDWVTEIDQLADEVRARVDEVAPGLPEGCREPHVNADFGDVASVVLSLHQGQGAHDVRYTPRQLQILAEVVSDELRRIPSVADVSLLGDQQEVIYLEVDSSSWSHLELTAEDLTKILTERNIVAPGGTLETSSGQIYLTPSGQFQDVNELAGVVVGMSDEGAPIRLSDLGRVSIHRTYVDPYRAKARFQSSQTPATECVLLAVEMKGGGNVVEMGAAIDAKVASLRARMLPPDVDLVVVNDLPRQVRTSIANFTGNLWQSILIVLGVAWFLMGLRPALIMALAIPVSMMSAIALMPAFQVELETFSIASLIIALGMVVDNAIVISDNSVHELGRTQDRLKALVRAAHSLAIPILTSTLTTVVVFAPMALMPGGSGEYVRSLPIVVALTLLLSYLAGMCLTPILCFLLLKPGVTPVAPITRLFRILSSVKGVLSRIRPKRREPEEVRRSLYERFLGTCTRWPLVTVGVAFALLFLSLQLLPIIGTQFFPPGYRDQFFVKVWLPNGTSVEHTEEVCKLVEEAARDTRVDASGQDRMVNTVSTVGFGGPRLMLTLSPESQYSHFAFVVINTTSPDATNSWIPELRQAVKDIPGARIQIMPAALGPPLDKPVEFLFKGSDETVLKRLASQGLALMRETQGIERAFSDWGNESRQISIDIHEEAANLAGVTNEDIASTMGGLLDGRRLTTYNEGDHAIDVVLRVRPREREELSSLDSIFVEGRNGKVPLSSVASAVHRWQPSVIRREDQVRTIGLGATVRDGYLANTLTLELEPKMRALLDGLPAEYRLEIAGELKETTEGQESQGNALILGLMGIVLVLVAQYNSILKPLVILLTLPLALIGSLMGLFLTGWSMGFMATLGIISLFGVVLNNAIVLIDFMEERVRSGAELRAAVIEAGKRRLSPIVLTTLTTVGGLLPLGLFGGPLFAPMAWAMIFGLGFSTVLTLVVIPTVYVLFAERLGMKVSDSEAS